MLSMRTPVPRVVLEKELSYGRARPVLCTSLRRERCGCGVGVLFFEAEGRKGLLTPKSDEEQPGNKLLDLPTFMRDKKNTATDESKPKVVFNTDNPVFKDNDVEDLDIPTFLRKQMD